MNKILSTDETITLSKQLQEQNKRIVLVGGCFDILHLAHLLFLQKARAQGDILFVLLESDEAIRIKKGPTRPLNTQADRAQLLAALEVVDFVISLPSAMENADYDALVIGIKPAIIATTKGDRALEHKTRQAKLCEGRVIAVIENMDKYSTTRLLKKIDL